MRSISKPMAIMLISLGVLFGGIVLYKAFVGLMAKRFITQAIASTRVAVSTTKVEYSPWQPNLRASGSVVAINGVYITTELAGLVQAIYLTPGAYVTTGTKLVQLNADSEIGQMHSLQAQVELAKLTYARDKAQYAYHAVSLQVVQNDEQNLKNLQGQLEQQKATVAKKSIVAPFSGRLGIRLVNLGQYINTGDKIVSLQALDPVYVDFYVPQQDLATVKVGQPVVVTTNAFPDKKFSGQITTIDSIVDPVSRNVLVEATVANPENLLTPGQFGNVEVSVGAPQSYLTIPQTAVTYNAFGNIVYIVTNKGKDSEGKPILLANQSFVFLGETRGDQVVVTKGLKEGDLIVTSGQVKLKNGSRVIINNTVQPADNAHPELKNEY